MEALPKVVKPEAERVEERVVAPVTLRVPVAVRLAKFRSPEKRALPWTAKALAGVVVPIPTLPV